MQSENVADSTVVGAVTSSVTVISSVPLAFVGKVTMDN
jgi:hypothetical protein